MLAPRKAWKYSVPPSARQTLPAVDLARTEVLAPVQRDQYPIVQTAERRQRSRGLDRFDEQSVERRRYSTIQHQTDIGVARDRRDAEQGFAVRPAMALRQRALMRQERRASHEEGRERRQADIRHRIVAVAQRPLAPVWKTGADLTQRPDQVLNGAHPAEESTIKSQRKTKSRRTLQRNQSIHRMWYIGLNSPHEATQTATHSH
jgi:hypothetical protein